MEDDNILETVADRLGQNGSIKNLYGEPITAHGKTIIPVAQLTMGMGGGYAARNGKHQQNPGYENQPEKAKGGEAGGGGGMVATAKGIFEVTEKRTRFIPANATRQLVAVSIIAYFLGRWMGARKLTNNSCKRLKI